LEASAHYLTPQLSAHGRCRRGMALAALAGWSGLLWSPAAHAGRQAEEPLVDSVRSALAAAVSNSAPPKPIFVSTEARLDYLRWLGEMSSRLRRRHRDDMTRDEFLETVWYESKRAGLETSLVLGLIQVESGFRKYAVSPVGARGYMQVMPFWARLIGNGDAAALFHMQTNLRFGCVILRHYLNMERGDLFMALGRYNGSRGRAEYPNMVFAARKAWEYRSTTQV
jgi:soluble lytic murein transglycosylase-like protein